MDATQPTPDGQARRPAETTPQWIFDIEAEAMHWANAAALRLWSAESLDALLARDFSSDMSVATRARLRVYLEELCWGRSLAEVWTLYPGGEPCTVLCRCSPAELPDGRTGMQVEVLDETPDVDPSSLRALEAVRHAPAYVSVHDADGRVIQRNPAALEQLGPGGHLGGHFLEARVRQTLTDALATQGQVSIEADVSTAGGPRHHLVEARHTRDPVTGHPLIVTYEQDITARHSLSESLATANELLETLVDSLPIAVLVEDEKRCIRHVNRAFCRMFGIEQLPHELLGADCTVLLRQARELFADSEGFAAAVNRRVADQVPVAGEEWETRDGRILARDYQPVFVGDRFRGHLWQYHDVTGQRRTERDLRQEAERDWLTGLPNRRAAEAWLSKYHYQIRETGEAVTLLMVDIDHFKSVNDRFGHAAGDELLVELGAALRGVLRQSDIVARIGGEEFLAALPSTSLGVARTLAERVRCAPRDHGCTRPDGAPLTISVGLAQLTPGDDAPANALRRVDAALYGAKRAGRDCVVEHLE